MSCDTTVAIAAPATPMRKVTMHRRSSPIFKTEEIIKNTSGVLASPMERITPDKVL